MKTILLVLLLAGGVTASCPAQQTAQSHLDRAKQLEDSGNPDGAIIEARQALEMKCANPADAYFQIGEALYDKGDKDGAIEAMGEATRLKPDFPAAYANMGIVLYERGDWDGSIAAYRKSLAVKDNALVRNYLGISYGQKGDFKSAIEEFRHEIALKPGDADAHDNLAHALRLTGDNEGAIAEYKRRCGSTRPATMRAPSFSRSRSSNKVTRQIKIKCCEQGRSASREGLLLPIADAESALDASRIPFTALS